MKDRRIRLTIDSDLDQVCLIGTTVNGLCKSASLSDVEAYQTQLAVVEAVTNIIKHAYQNRPGNTIDLSISMSPERMVFQLMDQGKSLPETGLPDLDFDPENLDSLPESGMGLFIIYNVMDEVRYETANGRNIQTFIKRLPPPPTKNT